jgi:hypothetical protein
VGRFRGTASISQAVVAFTAGTHDDALTAEAVSKRSRVAAQQSSQLVFFRTHGGIWDWCDRGKGVGMT